MSIPLVLKLYYIAHPALILQLFSIDKTNDRAYSKCFSSKITKFQSIGAIRKSLFHTSPRHTSASAAGLIRPIGPFVGTNEQPLHYRNNTTTAP